MSAAIIHTVQGYRTVIAYDHKAKVYWTPCSDVPGLVTEADTLRRMRLTIEYLIPFLLGPKDWGKACDRS